MKKIITILTFGLVLGSCTTDKYLLSVDEMKDYSVKGDTIFYKSTPIAVYTHWEYELNPSHGKKAKAIIELSIKHINIPPMADDLVKFIHTKHPKTKIEIVSPREFRDANH
jgi:hypothetical protein